MPTFLHRAQSSNSHRTLQSFMSNISRSNSPDAKAPLLSSAKPIEEELLPKYSAHTFYAAKIGDRLNDRYEVIAKLGFGMTATVWLARDTHASPGPGSRKYVTIKVNVNTLTEDFLSGRRAIAKKLMATNPQHIGYNHVRFMLDTFKIKSKYGEHLCIVYDVLREPLDECQEKCPNGVFGSDKLRKLLPSLLKGLDYMHSACHVVHTDLKPDNIMMGLGDDSDKLLDKFVQHLRVHPPPRKAPDPNDGHIIYKSSSDLLLVGPEDKGNSLNDSVLASAKLTDIGLAEFGDQGLQHKAIQSNAFTCPEVLLDAGWSYPADIWNLGAMMWDLIETQGLFDHINTQPGKYHANEHLALMICLLGPAPRELLDRGLKTSKYYDYDREKVEWVFKSQKLVDKWSDMISLENAVTLMQGSNKDSFIDFAKKMLAWLPEDRWTAAQLLQHPWLKANKSSVACVCQDFEEASRTMSEGAEEDAKMEKQRRSEASSIQYADTEGFSTKSGIETPPQGIRKRNTDGSLLSIDSLTSNLPSLSVTPAK